MPAAAVIRRTQALFGITGRKAIEGGSASEVLNTHGSTGVLHFELLNLRNAGVAGILVVGVKSVDNKRNTKSEGRLLGIF